MKTPPIETQKRAKMPKPGHSWCHHENFEFYSVAASSKIFSHRSPGGHDSTFGSFLQRFPSWDSVYMRPRKISAKIKFWIVPLGVPLNRGTKLRILSKILFPARPLVVIIYSDSLAHPPQCSELVQALQQRNQSKEIRYWLQCPDYAWISPSIKVKGRIPVTLL